MQRYEERNKWEGQRNEKLEMRNEKDDAIRNEKWLIK